MDTADQTVSQIFSSLGYYTAFADLSKAAYHLAAGELIAPGQTGVTGIVDNDGNYVKPYADDAWVRVHQDWQV